MRLTVLMLILAFTFNKVSAQRFFVTKDTVILERTLFGRSTADIKINSLCENNTDYFMLASIANVEGQSNRRFRQAVISINKKTREAVVTPVPLLPDWSGKFQSLFVRNDSVILKRNSYYHDDYIDYTLTAEALSEATTDKEKADYDESLSLFHDYVLNPETGQWAATGLADDGIWDDKSFHVTWMCGGEFGNYIFFHSRHDANRYIYGWPDETDKTRMGGIRRIFRHKGRYYILGRKGLFTITDPESGCKYDGTPLYKQQSHSAMETLISLPSDSSTAFVTAFVSKRKIYVITTENHSLYLYMVGGRQLTKVADLEYDTHETFETGAEIRQNNRPADEAIADIRSYNSRQRCLMTIDGNKIKITCFIIK